MASDSVLSLSLSRSRSLSLSARSVSQGQLFIFHTISTFGAVTFASMMTARQLLSLALSLAAFDHPVHGVGYAGLALVFVALGAKVVEDVHKSANPKQKDKTAAGTHSHADRDEGSPSNGRDGAVELQRLLPANSAS